MTTCGKCGSDDLIVRASGVHYCVECEATWYRGEAQWTGGAATRAMRHALDSVRSVFDA